MFCYDNPLLQCDLLGSIKFYVFLQNMISPTKFSHTLPAEKLLFQGGWGVGENQIFLVKEVGLSL